MTSIQPVLLCGGVGSRLRPLSQDDFPKQFHKIFSNNTMLQNTLLRLKKNWKAPIITTNIKYKSLVIKEADFSQQPTIILEPIKIGTAASILVAVANCHEDTIVIVLPTDHHIENVVNFRSCLEQAVAIAKSTDAIVTIGIKPDHFNSGYGYIKAIYNDNTGCYSIDQFIEKPSNSNSLFGEYYWNSGIFIFKAKYYLNEIAKLAPNIYKACVKGRQNSIIQKNLVYLRKVDFAKINPTSFDYMIMEQRKDALMIEATFDWVDIGTWSGILSIVSRRSYFNYRNCYIKEVISDQSTLCEIKEKIIRPWGFYSVIMKSKNFLIKYLYINPASATSMQLHKHRSEYYTILSGTAHVTLNDKVNVISQNEVIKISQLDMHRIENKDSENAVKIIEIQIGDYISENDIVRFADIYGRV